MSRDAPGSRPGPRLGSLTREVPGSWALGIGHPLCRAGAVVTFIIVSLSFPWHDTVTALSDRRLTHLTLLVFSRYACQACHHVKKKPAQSFSRHIPSTIIPRYKASSRAASHQHVNSCEHEAVRRRRRSVRLSDCPWPGRWSLVRFVWRSSLGRSAVNQLRPLQGPNFPGWPCCKVKMICTTF